MSWRALQSGQRGTCSAADLALLAETEVQACSAANAQELPHHGGLTRERQQRIARWMREALAAHLPRGR